MAASENHFTPLLNEKEVTELLENATPGSIKKATKCGMKIFQGKNLKTLSELWSSQLWTQFKQLRIEAWKKQDLSGVWTRDLAIPVRRFYTQLLKLRSQLRRS